MVYYRMDYNNYILLFTLNTLNRTTFILKKAQLKIDEKEFIKLEA
jgi:hypothetical protein